VTKSEAVILGWTLLTVFAVVIAALARRRG
jgi:hypothetical protein